MFAHFSLSGLKKKKICLFSGTLKTKSRSATKEKNITVIPQVDVNKPQNEQRLSRQQWKTKMKNKRKCKNKYRQDKPEENVNKPQTADRQELNEEIKIDSHGNNSNCKNIGHTEKYKRKEEQKPLKRKHTDEETVLFTPTSKKKQQEAEKKTKGGKVKTSVSGDPADGSEQDADGLQVKIPSTPQQNLTKAQKPALNKERRLKRQKLQTILLGREKEEENKATVPEDEEKQVNQSSSDTLRSRMKQQLDVARFRYINELLYTTTSGEARRMFRQDPQAFWVYHKGYTAQVQRWPSNPVDAIISYIQKR